MLLARSRLESGGKCKILIVTSPNIFNLLLLLQFGYYNCATASPDLFDESTCVSCIGSAIASLGIDTARKCEGYYCGRFQFSYTYWAEAGKPATLTGQRDFERCAREKQCSETTVKSYYKRFKKDCDSDKNLTCLDMAALHRGGSASCSSDWLYKSKYWQAFNRTQCVTGESNQASSSTGEELANFMPPSHKIMKNESLTPDCLDCICEALSGCNSNTSSTCGSGAVCGPFSISQAYWKDGM